MTSNFKQSDIENKNASQCPVDCISISNHEIYQANDVSPSLDHDKIPLPFRATFQSNCDFETNDGAVQKEKDFNASQTQGYWNDVPQKYWDSLFDMACNAAKHAPQD
jgi:hypothetical protein